MVLFKDIKLSEVKILGSFVLYKILYSSLNKMLVRFISVEQGY